MRFYEHQTIQQYKAFRDLQKLRNEWHNEALRDRSDLIDRRWRMGIYALIVIGLALAAWTVFRADYPIRFSLALAHSSAKYSMQLACHRIFTCWDIPPMSLTPAQRCAA